MAMTTSPMSSISTSRTVFYQLRVVSISTKMEGQLKQKLCSHSILIMSVNNLRKIKIHVLPRNHSLNLTCLMVTDSTEEMTVKVKDSGSSSTKHTASKEINYGPTKKFLQLTE
jgi:hypothetical protein